MAANVLVFDKNEWKSITVSRQSPSCSDPLATSALKINTYNIWFSNQDRTQRTVGLLEIFKTEKSDVIGMQEVTQWFEDQLKVNEFVQEKYNIVKEAHTSSGYYVMFLVRKSIPISSATCSAFRSAQGRVLMIMDCLINDKKITIATAHFESNKACENTRMVQLEQTFNILNKQKHAFLMGDFNFHTTWPEQRCIPEQWADAWRESLGDDDSDEKPGFTEDTVRNLMMFKAKGKTKQVRFDRIYCLSKSFRTTSCRLVGTQPINDKQTIWPSDHFGLVATFSLKRKSSP